LKQLKEVAMTPALEMLLNSRKVKTEQEVEEDFKNMQEQKLLTESQPALKKKTQAKASMVIDALN
jgi:hypothetical protein